MEKSLEKQNCLIIRKKNCFRCELYEDGYYIYYGKEDIVSQSEAFCILTIGTHSCYCEELSCICVVLIKKHI